jgi:predicted DCC family thiol-disulfide oxidoreductase YuxK
MPPTPTIMLYDGWCSVCSKSAAKLRKLDNGRARIVTADLRKDTYLLEQHKLNPTDVRRVMHAITPNGQVLTAMDALRHCMNTVGRGWMLGWTKTPLIHQITDHMYLAFANNRLRWFAKHKCTDGTCAISQRQATTSEPRENDQPTILP